MHDTLTTTLVLSKYPVKSSKKLDAIEDEKHMRKNSTIIWSPMKFKKNTFYYLLAKDKKSARLTW